MQGLWKRKKKRKIRKKGMMRENVKRESVRPTCYCTACKSPSNRVTPELRDECAIMGYSSG
jgi:hypothetical protein